MDMPEEPAIEKAPKSLIGQIAGMFTSKTAKSGNGSGETDTLFEDVPQPEPKPEAAPVAAREKKDPVVVKMPEMAPPADAKAEEQTSAGKPPAEKEKADEAEVAIQAETASKDNSQDNKQDSPAAAESQMGGLATLKPAEQPKLDMAQTAVDVDLDIPAFLRRQAN